MAKAKVRILSKDEIVAQNREMWDRIELRDRDLEKAENEQTLQEAHSESIPARPAEKVTPVVQYIIAGGKVTTEKEYVAWWDAYLTRKYAAMVKAESYGHGYSKQANENACYYHELHQTGIFGGLVDTKINYFRFWFRELGLGKGDGLKCRLRLKIDNGSYDLNAAFYKPAWKEIVIDPATGREKEISHRAKRMSKKFFGKGIHSNAVWAAESAKMSDFAEYCAMKAGAKIAYKALETRFSRTGNENLYTIMKDSEIYSHKSQLAKDALYDYFCIESELIDENALMVKTEHAYYMKEVGTGKLVLSDEIKAQLAKGKKASEIHFGVLPVDSKKMRFAYANPITELELTDTGKAYMEDKDVIPDSLKCSDIISVASLAISELIQFGIVDSAESIYNFDRYAYSRVYAYIEEFQKSVIDYGAGKNGLVSLNEPIGESNDGDEELTVADTVMNSLIDVYMTLEYEDFHTFVNNVCELAGERVNRQMMKDVILTMCDQDLSKVDTAKECDIDPKQVTRYVNRFLEILRKNELAHEMLREFLYGSK